MQVGAEGPLEEAVGLGLQELPGIRHGASIRGEGGVKDPTGVGEGAALGLKPKHESLPQPVPLPQSVLSLFIF